MLIADIKTAMKTNQKLFYRDTEYKPIALTVRKHPTENRFIYQVELKDLKANSIVVVSPEMITENKEEKI